MKCPKCGYLGYQDVERCRNCGYEFSLVSGSSAGDLRLRDTEPESAPASIGDLDLIDTRMAAAARQALAAAVERPADPQPPQGDASEELPLFDDRQVDDTPLITKASPPRPPLAVRRATPEVPRLRAESRMPANETPQVTSLAPFSMPKPAPKPGPTPSPDLLPEPEVVLPLPPPEPAPVRSVPAVEPLKPFVPPVVPPVEIPTRPARAGERMLAALIDITLLLCIDAVIVYFALKVCRLSMSEILLLPPVPTGAFLLLQNFGYLVAFTTAGQTLGKMLTGLRVVDADSGRSPAIGRAALRSALTLLLALPAGLGLLPVLFTQDGRGLHDRMLGTWVVHVAD